MSGIFHGVFETRDVENLDVDGALRVVILIAHERVKTTKPNLLQSCFHLYHLLLSRGNTKAKIS